MFTALELKRIQEILYREFERDGVTDTKLLIEIDTKILKELNRSESYE